MVKTNTITQKISALICACILFTVYSPFESEAAENRLILPDIQVRGSERNSFGILLETEQVIGGAQIRLKFDSTIGFMITDVSLTSRTAGYEQPSVNISLTEIGKAEVDIVLFSLNGAAIIPGKGEILRIHYRTTCDVCGESPLTFQEVILSNLESEPLPVSFENGRVSAECSFGSTGERPVSPPAVPEPGTFFLFGIGIVSTLIVRKRQNSKRYPILKL